MAQVDIRILVSFPRHPKTVLLRQRLGSQAIDSLIQLWCYCRENKPKGDLSGMSDDAIESAAGWTGERGKFIEHVTGKDTRFIDRKGKKTLMHDWEEHNGWAYGAPERTVKAKIAALISHGKTAEADALRRACAEHAPSRKPHAKRTAPSPSPSPSQEKEGPKTHLPPGVNPDKINSDTPLPPILQAEWNLLLEVYPGPVTGRDKAIRLFVKSAERARIIRNAGHYAQSEMAKAGKVFALDRFVAEAFRDFDESPSEPLGGVSAESPGEELLTALKSKAACMPKLSEGAERIFRQAGLSWPRLQEKVMSGEKVF